MINKNISNSDNTTSDPSSSCYNKKLKDKAHEKSPFGKNEPSPNTDFK